MSEKVISEYLSKFLYEDKNVNVNEFGWYRMIWVNKLR